VAENTKGGKIVCTYEMPVGTHFRERHCVFEEDADLERQRTVDTINQHTSPLKQGN
jgi:hypothetical protein